MYHRSIKLSAAVCMPIVAIIAIVAMEQPVRADSTTPASYTIAPAPAGDPPAVDGNVDAPAWKKGTHVSLGWDLRFGRPAREHTDVYLLSDPQYLYVAFDVEQRNGVTATQHTDDVGFDTDDEIQVDIWPGGANGFRYLFTATPLGTHYSHSSENSNYSPKWLSAGKATPTGYAVTMRIPLDAMRGDGRSTWLVQFVRFNQRTGEKYVWSHQPQQTDHNDPTYAGALGGMQAAAASARTKARIAMYSLASLASPVSGGSTSRAGADWAVPVTPTASFIGTVHPDYSNVDLDQQTISPTAFQRFYQEVRPFFTQGSSFYNPFDCVGCPGIQELYTPSIPTPRTGYAVEGTQGTVRFGAFDAIGTGRTDSAQSVYVTNPNRTNWLEFQRVASDALGLHDDVSTYGAEYTNRKNAFTYLNYGQDRGTRVLDPTQGDRLDFGSGMYGQNWFVGGSLRKVGQYYTPYDGIVQHPGIAGYDFNFDNARLYSPSNAITKFEYQGWVDRYHGAVGGLNQSDTGMQFDVSMRTQFHATVSTGSSYLLLQNGVFAPVTQQGAGVSYRAGTSLPTSVWYNIGRFGDGFLRTWTRQTTLPAGALGTIQFEGDDTEYMPNQGERFSQWLERASFTYQLSKDSSLAIGLRRIIGAAPPLGGPPSGIDAANVSFAYHRRLSHDELYFVYGDPNNLSTTPAFILKLVHYFGADKGT